MRGVGCYIFNSFWFDFHHLKSNIPKGQFLRDASPKKTGRGNVAVSSRWRFYQPFLATPVHINFWVISRFFSEKFAAHLTFLGCGAAFCLVIFWDSWQRNRWTRVRQYGDEPNPQFWGIWIFFVYFFLQFHSPSGPSQMEIEMSSVDSNIHDWFLLEIVELTYFYYLLLYFYWLNLVKM